MIPELPMLFRRQMRLAVIAALERASLMVDNDQVSIDSPGDWAMQDSEEQGTFPCIFVRTGHENKPTTVRAGLPQFNSTVDIEVMAVLTSTTAEKAQDDMELLWYQVENLLLTDYSIIGSIQCVEAVESQFTCKSNGHTHIAAMTSVFRYEGFEVFDSQALMPDVDTDNPFPDQEPTVPLNEAVMNFDLVNVADPTGTYSDHQFSQAVEPAPRSKGPDGRNEAVLKMPLG